MVGVLPSKGPAKVSARAGWTDQICFFQVQYSVDLVMYCELKLVLVLSNLAREKTTSVDSSRPSWIWPRSCQCCTTPCLGQHDARLPSEPRGSLALLHFGGLHTWALPAGQAACPVSCQGELFASIGVIFLCGRLICTNRTPYRGTFRGWWC